MSVSKQLAARLRQSVQGCTLHPHGPIHAWSTIEDACKEGQTNRQAVARESVISCSNRIASLIKEGASPNDKRILKEELTRAFIERLLLGK